MTTRHLDPWFAGRHTAAMLVLGLTHLTDAVASAVPPPSADDPATTVVPAPFEAFLLGVLACHQLLTDFARPSAGRSTASRDASGGEAEAGPPPADRQDDSSRWWLR